MDTCHECVDIVEQLNVEFSELQDKYDKMVTIKDLFKVALIKKIMLVITNENDREDLEFNVNEYLEENGIKDFDDKVDFIESLKKCIKDTNNGGYIDEFNEGNEYIYYKKYNINRTEKIIYFITQCTICVPKDDIDGNGFDVYYESGNYICPNSEKMIKDCNCSYCNMIKAYYRDQRLKLNKYYKSLKFIYDIIQTEERCLVFIYKLPWNKTKYIIHDYR